IYTLSLHDALPILTTIILNIIIAKPITASHADFSPCQPRDKRRWRNAAEKNQVISAQTSFGSQPQNLSQAICAHIAAKIKPPKVNTGNPIATERYITSSTSCGLIFLSQVCTLAPTRFLVSNRINPYKTVPAI